MASRLPWACSSSIQHFYTNPSTYVLLHSVRACRSTLASSLRYSDRLYATGRTTGRRIPSAKSLPVKTRQPPANTSVPVKPTPSYESAQVSYARTLALKPSPTLIYMGPSSNRYKIACYSLASFFVCYGTWQIYELTVIPHNAVWWPIPLFMGSIFVVMIVMGGLIGASARRMLRSISAIPVKGGARAGALEDLTVRLEARRLLSTLPAQVFERTPEQLRLSKKAMGLEVASPITGKPVPILEAKRQAELKAAEEKRRDLRTIDVLLSPFSDARKAFSKAFDGLGRLVTREGFVMVYIDGKAWSVDAKNGWLLDDGRALDRLIKVR